VPKHCEDKKKHVRKTITDNDYVTNNNYGKEHHLY